MLQTFPTSGGKAAMSFEVQNELFVAFINHGNSSVKYKAKLPGYVLQNNTFTLNQTLDTSGITDVEYFTIHGEHFLAVVNALDGKSTKEGFVLYRFEAETFKEIQHIPIYNVQDIHYFIINTRIFMANSMTFSNQVSIYELKNNKTQNIASAAHLPLTTSRTLHVAAWLISMQAQFWYGLETNFNYSRIFPRPVSLDCPHSFEANGILYLAIPNYKPPHTGQTAINSYIYRWDGTKFVHHQDIPTDGAMDWDSFTTTDGQKFLVVAKAFEQSALYKMSDSKFNLYQKLPTTGAVYVHASKYKGKQYLATVNHFDGKSFNFDSAVYI